ncbi:hypothetical protein FIBSPDRAFT_933763 [Athelia psychrophila]|uniref:Uncharacterized protein n=1 Tax=Athelia psychrophila TaxID=1759441 RepID=A0A166GGQ0_9AGAM|nr:hypothetical protein FIBSPDRAFT_933763 [Fibularhizoctonia sp. CBS 109695]
MPLGAFIICRKGPILVLYLSFVYGPLYAHAAAIDDHLVHGPERVRGWNTYREWCARSHLALFQAKDLIRPIDAQHHSKEAWPCRRVPHTLDVPNLPVDVSTWFRPRPAVLRFAGFLDQPDIEAGLDAWQTRQPGEGKINCMQGGRVWNSAKGRDGWLFSFERSHHSGSHTAGVLSNSVANLPNYFRYITTTVLAYGISPRPKDSRQDTQIPTSNVQDLGLCRPQAQASSFPEMQDHTRCFWASLFERLDKVLKSCSTTNHTGDELATIFCREFARNRSGQCVQERHHTVLNAMHVLRPPYHLDRAYFNFSLTPTLRQRLIPARGDSSILGKRAASN